VEARAAAYRCCLAGDVYFFCGAKMQYCTCNFRWNMAGWYKAAVLWSFVLSAALGVQRLIIQLGLKGLLPGKNTMMVTQVRQ
jgi:hypothetical protein